MLSDRRAAAIGHLGVYREGTRYRVVEENSALITGGQPAGVVNFVVEKIFVQFMQARKEFLWLHAAAVERDGRALVIAGESGQGKSTVSTFLCELGWHFMSDDVLALRIENDEVIPFLLTPARRAQAGLKILTDLASLAKETVNLHEASLQRTPTKISSVVFPRFDPTARPSIARMSRGDAALELLRHTRNIVDHGPDAPSRIARLMRKIDSFSLTFGFDGEGIDLIDSEL